MVLNETSTAIVSIDELQGQGINASDIQKLRAAGICSITVSELVSIRHPFNALIVLISRSCQQPEETC